METFPTSPFWKPAFASSQGRGIFVSDTDILEDTAVRRYYNQWGSKKKASMKLLATTAHLTVEKKLELLKQQLLDLKQDPNVLSDDLAIFLNDDDTINDLVNYISNHINQSDTNTPITYGNFKQSHLKKGTKTAKIDKL
jgi:hypothetical protein